MIRSLTSAANGLTGALLLARGRADGLRYLDCDLAGAARSFLAAAICLPGLVGLRAMDWAAAGTPAQPVDALLRDVLAYIIGWAGYAVLSHAVVGAIGRSGSWPRFIAAWNWCNVVQYALLAIASFPPALGAPPMVGQAASLIAVGRALWLEWFAARLTLQVAALPAAAFVLMDVALGLVLATVTR